MNRKLKNTVKNRWDCVGIFTCACVCVCVRAHVHLCGLLFCIFVCMCKWYIVHVYVKVHVQHVVLTGC